MTELYINGELCDVGEDFGVRLNRKLISLSELSLKDSQFSFTVSLPFTETNDKLLDFVGIEEVKGKFVREYEAELIVKSVQIFKGKFRLSEIGVKGYKGNLYLPPLKTAKDVFGDKVMSETIDVEVPFTDFQDSVEDYNTRGENEIQKLIFPLVLYGIPPKAGADFSTPVNTWDDKIRLSMHNLYPSVNVLSLLKDMFAGEGYALSGSALQDPDLQGLYMSYHNPPEYALPWNYARNGVIEVEGKWSNVTDVNNSGPAIERGAYDISGIYACDLLDCTNARVRVRRDPGGNVLQTSVEKDGRTWRRVQIMVPASGYYKVSFKAGTRIVEAPTPVQDPKAGVSVIGTDLHASGTSSLRTSIKLLRDKGTGGFGLSASKMDASLYLDNLPQNDVYNLSNTPKYIPFYKGRNFGSDLFVDPLQNKYLLTGFQWGSKSQKDVNPKDNDFAYSYSLFAKPGYSWNRAVVGNDFTHLITNTRNGYYLYTQSSTGNSPIWERSGLFSYWIEGTSVNRALRGRYEGYSGNRDIFSEGSNFCIAWLEAGEILTVADVSDEGGVGDKKGWVSKECYFSLLLEPYQTDKKWLQLGDKAEQKKGVRWDEKSGFLNDTINLTKFLPSDIKASDFIENFCKAFNLRLSHVEGNKYSLNVSLSREAVSLDVVDLNNLVSVEEKVNLPLDLPEFYKIGFTDDSDTDLYLAKDEGQIWIGGRSAGIEQKSFFSPTRVRTFNVGGGRTFYAASISKAEAWRQGYPDGLGRRYTDLPIRFWYHGGVQSVPGWRGGTIVLARPYYWRNSGIFLEYKKNAKSILTKYFPILATREGHFTEIEVYLTPALYAALDGSRAVVFNDDVYLVAEVIGYDPTGRNKSKIKLLKYEERV